MPEMLLRQCAHHDVAGAGVVDGAFCGARGGTSGAEATRAYRLLQSLDC